MYRDVEDDGREEAGNFYNPVESLPALIACCYPYVKTSNTI